MSTALELAVEAAHAGLPGATPARPLPSPLAVATIADDARALMLPELQSGELRPDRRHRLRVWAEAVRATLVLDHHARCEKPSPCARCETWALDTAATLVRGLPELAELVAGDLQAALDADPAAQSRGEVVLCYPGFHAITSHRLAHLLWRAGARLSARLMSEHAHAHTGIDLHPGAAVGRRFFIDHGTGVVVGETALIGDGVRLYQGVTLGARSVPREQAAALHGVKRHPTLEDDVIVYANATILGGDTVIGRGAIIGGNVWLTTSVPAGGRVMVEGLPSGSRARG